MQWHKECPVIHSETQWTAFWKSKPLITKSLHIKLLSFKLTSWWYWTLVKLSHMNNSASPFCWKLCEERGTYLHCWCNCEKKKSKLWRENLIQITWLTGYTVPHHPEVILLNLWVNQKVLAIRKDLETSVRNWQLLFFLKKEMAGQLIS